MTRGDEAREALYSISPNLRREEWVKLAFACKDAGLGEEDWLQWCEAGETFNRADALATYRNAKPMAGGVTEATLWRMAHDAGWRRGNGSSPIPPRKTPAEQRKPTPTPPPTDPVPVWEMCRAVDVHPYLARKRVRPHGMRQSATGALVVPFVNRERQLQTLQFIAPDGSKKFLAGARQKGSVWIAGEPTDAELIVIGEGPATCAAIHEATGRPVIASGSRGTMPEAARIARHFSPRARVVLAADRGDLTTPMSAARGVEGFLALPGSDTSPEGYDFCDWRNDGASDAEITERIESAPPVPLNEEQAPPPAELPPGELITEAEVEHYLTDDKGKPVANLSNIAAWLIAGHGGALAFDQFTGHITWQGEPIKEHDYVALTRVVQRGTIDKRHPFNRAGTNTVADAVHLAAHAHEFNSCRQWLETLPPWDGIERIAKFFVDVAGCDAGDYIHAVGRYFWLGLVSRMLSPGFKVDSAVALVGAQGIGKSSLGRIIGGERFGEVGLHDIGSRDWCMQLVGKVVVEIAELSGHSRAELETIKAILTRTHDDYRGPYQRLAASVPRGNVFIATTNESEFLLDPSGNRRWLPVVCGGPLALDTARSMRDAYYAEAFHLVGQGLPSDWHIVPGARERQATHLAIDPWVDVLEEKLRGETGEHPEAIANVALYQALGIPAERQSGGFTGRRLAAVMRTLGYARSVWRPDPTSRRQVRGFVRVGSSGDTSHAAATVTTSDA